MVKNMEVDDQGMICIHFLGKIDREGDIIWLRIPSLPIKFVWNFIFNWFSLKIEATNNLIVFKLIYFNW